jgi:2-desacetyl-2-hydroxyethyl bacteriochlorophyllide A dehydrogenase
MKSGSKGAMKTIILEEPGRFSLTDTAKPNRANPSEALVRVHRVGICGTDLHAFEGTQSFFTYPRIVGHELGVEIVEIDSNEFDLKTGDSCALEPYLHCGECIACRRGKTNCCVNLKVMGVHVDGGMREYITVPIHKLHKSNQLSCDQLALVETLGIGAHAVRRANPQPDDVVLIIGVGPIGLTVLTFVKSCKAPVIVMDINENRLDFCRNAINVENCIHANRSAADSIQKLLGGELPTVVFDCTGNSESMQDSFQLVANGGSLIFVGLYKGNLTFHDPEFHRRELTLYASRNSTAEDFKRIISLMENNEIDASPWITHRVPFTKMIDEFPQWLQPENRVLKAMVEW